MLNKLNNRKGSALTYVLIIMMLLSILGLALVSSTITNFQINRKTSAINKSFYINDGAIEEALAELKEISHRAEVDASAWISGADRTPKDPDLKRFYQDQKWVSFFHNLDSLLETGAISDEEAARITEEAYKREFTKRYYSYFLDTDDTDGNIYLTDYRLFDDNKNFVETNDLTLKTGLKLKTDYLSALQTVSFTPNNNADFSAAVLRDITVSIDTSSNKANVTLVSSGRYNEFNKSITCEVEVTPPKYRYVVSTTTKNKKIMKNQLLDNALSAYGNIIVADGPVTVNGNVYSYGTFPDNYDNYDKLGGIFVGMNWANMNPIVTHKDSKQLGKVKLSGIAADNSKGNITVNGDLISRTGIKVNGSSSYIKVTESVYANTFSVEKNSNNFVGNIDKHLFLLEDLMFFGKDTKFTVGDENKMETGTIWNLLDKIPSGTNGLNRNISGSIVVDKSSSGTKLKSNRYIIAGVVYLDLYRELSDVEYGYYQTGLSFTTNKNNDYYAYKISSTDKSTDFFEYNFLSNPESKVDLIEVVGTNGSIKLDNTYKSIHFIEKNKEVEDKIETGLPAVEDKDKLIYDIASIRKKKSGDEQNYSLGVMMGNGMIFNPYKMKPIIITDINGIETEDSINNRKNYEETFVNMTQYKFEVERAEVIPIVDEKTNLLGSRVYQTSSNSGSRLDDFINFKDNIERTSDPKNFIIVNKNPDKDIYLNIPHNMVNSIGDNDAIIIESKTDSMDINGFIATKGNVYIYNASATKYVFNGPIISDKSIILYGPGEKEINNSNPVNDYNDILVSLIVKNEDIYDITNSKNGRKIEIEDGSKSTTGDVIAKVVTNDITISPTINSNINFEGIIRTEEADTIIINRWSETN